MSFRDVPRDIQTICDEIALNVRRGLAKLDGDDANLNISNITRQLSDVTIENMTSMDISKDPRSHYRMHEGKLRDIIFVKKYWQAICGNANLFKDKV